MEKNFAEDKEYLSKGLSDAEISERVGKGLVNGVQESHTKSVKQIIRENIFTFFNLLNIILGFLVFLTGSYKNCLFLGVIFFNILIGIFQEIRAKRVVDKLSLVSAPKAVVLRNGAEKEINTAEIVADELTLLNAGRQICSDCVVVEGECEVNESLITGESDPVPKRAGDEMMSGSFVVSGNVKARVNRIGADNFASKITAGAKYIKKNNSVILKALDTIIKVIAVCIIPLALGLFINSIVISEQPTDRAIVSTAAALIGMIPEGLYLLTSVVMAVATMRLAAHKTLAQDMYCIETLARVDTLCLDKTGTITEGIMQVEGTELLEDGFPLDEAMTAFVSVMNDDNPTFNAVKTRWGSGISRLPEAKKTVPFSSARKWSGAEFEKGCLIFGAPEFVLREQYGKIREKCERAQREGLRVLTAAYSAESFAETELPRGLKAAALIFIGDVIRKEAPATLGFFDKQGVDIKIISGDNPVTVSKIAHKAGVKNAELTVDASTLSDGDIPDAAEKYTVFGRVSPNQKLLLVKALKAKGKTVGMTGDGVNDVLALKEADCSIAMQSGSDAARSVSNLVLLDSNFASMPLVVAEGRRSVNNLQRSGTLFLAKTVYSVILAFIFIFLPIPYPFQPIQLTLISSLSIGVPSFLLALQSNTDIIKGGFIRNILRISLPQGAAVALGVIISAVCCECFGLSTEVMSTVTAYVAAAIGFFTVARVLKPVRPWKIGMLVVLTAAFVGAALIMPNMFGFYSIGLLGFCIMALTAAVGIETGLLTSKVTDRLLDIVIRIFIRVRKPFRSAKAKILKFFGKERNNR
ncbi:MAG: cation-translocating P-type ATPase [Bacteroides sp.]|nr:cation-translocating P-type ATPase [Bacteroides sp.]